MPSEHRSLKFTLPLTFILAFAAVQLALWASVTVVLGRHLQARFDGELLASAQTFIEMYGANAKDQPGMAPAELVRKALTPLESAERFVLVYLADTNEYVRSANLRGLRFPAGEPGSPATPPSFQTLSSDMATLLGPGGQMRVATVYPDKFRGYAQVGSDLSPIQRLQSNIQRLMMIFGVATLLVAALVSWLVTQRAVAPLSALAERVRSMSLSAPGAPVRVPNTGDEVHEVAVAFNTLIERLQREFKNQQGFVANAAHELKTPLAVLLVSVQNHKRHMAGDESQTAFLVSVEEEVRRLLRTVESFLLLTRTRSGRGLELISEVSLEDVAVSATHGCAAEARTRGVQIVPKLEDPAGAFEPVVLGDPDLLTTMVENLIGNAVRHSPPNGVVEIETRATAKEAQISVRDRGPGIPVEHQARVFDMFYQVHSGELSEGKAGIGLTIVKAVCELHGGTVAVSNRDGGGCEFLVRLPIGRNA
jgi:signal transduction histidine kinase